MIVVTSGLSALDSIVPNQTQIVDWAHDLPYLLVWAFWFGVLTLYIYIRDKYPPGRQTNAPNRSRKRLPLQQWRPTDRAQ